MADVNRIRINISDGYLKLISITGFCYAKIKLSKRQMDHLKTNMEIENSIIDDMLDNLKYKNSILRKKIALLEKKIGM